MRILIVSLFLILSPSINADRLCATNEKVESDMRIPESYFSKENAEAALKKLQGIVSDSDKNYEWITIPNSLKIIEGYVLRRDALASTGAAMEYKVSAFCTFMETSAWWYD